VPYHDGGRGALLALGKWKTVASRLILSLKWEQGRRTKGKIYPLLSSRGKKGMGYWVSPGGDSRFRFKQREKEDKNGESGGGGDK